MGIVTLDKNLQPLSVGDRVGFVMGGFFREREQESFGLIREIDAFGGITIEVSGVYRHFLSNGKVGETTRHVYFVHHVYDVEKKARIYRTLSGSHEVYLAKFE